MPQPTQTEHQFILASASPRRREILRRLGVRFLVDPSSADEPEPAPGEGPVKHALRLARFKAREVRKRHSSGIVIGADTIVTCGRKILGKPRSARDARSMLRCLGGRWHEVITGVCLIDAASGKTRSAYSRSRVHIRRLTGNEIDWYLATGEYRDKAGAYAIQGHGALLVDRLEGCYYNVVGFPVVTFLILCRRLGVRLIP